MYLQKVKSKKYLKKQIFVGILKVINEKSRIQLQICTKMSRIQNTGIYGKKKNKQFFTPTV
jgi:hypothetical protein